MRAPSCSWILHRGVRFTSSAFIDVILESANGARLASRGYAVKLIVPVKNLVNKRVIAMRPPGGILAEWSLWSRGKKAEPVLDYPTDAKAATYWPRVKSADSMVVPQVMIKVPPLPAALSSMVKASTEVVTVSFFIGTAATSLAASC